MERIPYHQDVVVYDGRQGSWSPDGARLVFKGCVGGDCGLWIINSDSSGRVRLTTNENDSSPAWSPDGSMLAFRSDRSGTWAVYVMNADGSNVTKLVEANVQLKRWDYERLSWSR